jgi:hypothetical protein
MPEISFAEIQTTPIRSTDGESLLLTATETNKIVADIRDIVTDDPYIKYLRKSIPHDLPELETVTVGSETCLVVYRGIKPDHDQATTAAGLCKNRGSKTGEEGKLQLQHQLDLVEEYHKAISAKPNLDPTSDNHPGRRFFTQTIGGHMAESDYSLLIPAANAEYAAGFRTDQQLLKLTVPLKYIVPVYYQANTTMPTFSDEKELAIAGRIEPNWVEVVPPESIPQILLREKQRKERYQQLEAEKLESEKKSPSSRNPFVTTSSQRPIVTPI